MLLSASQSLSGVGGVHVILTGRVLETEKKTSIALLNLSLAHLLGKENGDCEFELHLPKLNPNSLSKSRFDPYY